MDEIEPFHPLPTAQVQPDVDVLGIPLAIEFLLSFCGAQVILTETPQGKGMVECCVGTKHAASLAQALPLIRRVPVAKAWLAKVFMRRVFPPPPLRAVCAPRM